LDRRFFGILSGEGTQKVDPSALVESSVGVEPPGRSRRHIGPPPFQPLVGPQDRLDRIASSPDHVEAARQKLDMEGVCSGRPSHPSHGEDEAPFVGRRREPHDFGRQRVAVGKGLDRSTQMHLRSRAPDLHLECAVPEEQVSGLAGTIEQQGSDARAAESPMELVRYAPDHH